MLGTHLANISTASSRFLRQPEKRKRALERLGWMTASLDTLRNHCIDSVFSSQRASVVAELKITPLASGRWRSVIFSTLQSVL